MNYIIKHNFNNISKILILINLSQYYNIKVKKSLDKMNINKMLIYNYFNLSFDIFFYIIFFIIIIFK